MTDNNPELQTGHEPAGIYIINLFNKNSKNYLQYKTVDK